MKRWEIEEMLKLRRHLGNVNEETFSHIGWKTKRRGLVAYDASGKSIEIEKSFESLFPAFVQEDEYIKGMEVLKKANN